MGWIEFHWTDAYNPEDNGLVEKMHGARAQPVDDCTHTAEFVGRGFHIFCRSGECESG